jgi:hypothetical protein
MPTVMVPWGLVNVSAWANTIQQLQSGNLIQQHQNTHMQVLPHQPQQSLMGLLGNNGIGANPQLRQQIANLLAGSTNGQQLFANNITQLAQSSYAANPNTTRQAATQPLPPPPEELQIYDPPPPRDGPTMLLYMDRDEDTLSEYQCFLRKQLEIFEAGPDDVRCTAQGRNTAIILDQVGVRCIHCAHLPRAAKTKGAAYYSRTIDGIYQIAQNMSKVHLCERCQRIPPDIRAKLSALRIHNRRAACGIGYWSDGVRALGVYEDGRILRLKKPTPKETPPPESPQKKSPPPSETPPFDDPPSEDRQSDDTQDDKSQSEDPPVKSP